ncbi:MAG: hypothetical protein CSB49_02635 [Proteobacteria bacterium]|nr:MAG: hypothetical protein CSB49_02635 [Pseudomonadota bacterium]
MLPAVIQRHPLIVAGLLLALGTTSAYAAPSIMPVAQIRSGQKGYGLSVFKGYKIERFSVEVIDVLKNFLPKQDIILMRGDHAVLRRAGVLGGMSGSPIYLNGKLVGALAYGWRWSKEPIFGVTPIGNMLPLFQRKTRGPDKTLRVARNDPVTRSRLRRLLASLEQRTDPFAKLRWRLPRRSKPRGNVLQRVSVPLSVAGMPTSSLPELRQAFARYGFEPVQGGGTGKANQGPKRYEQGSAIGVSLVRGDISMTGTGTVTYVKGTKVVAFGHSMFNAGEIYLPMTTAKINHTLASVSRSFKLSSPSRRLGVLIQDRQPGVMADTAQTVSMVPMTVTLKSKLHRSVYKMRLAKHRLLTHSLVRSVLTKSIKEAMSDVAPSTYTMTSSYSFKGHPTLTIKEENYTSGGLRMGLFFSRGVRAIRAMTTNPIAEVDLQRIDVEIDVTFGKRPLTLLSLRTPASVVKPGQTIRLEATLREYGGKKVKRTFPLTIPTSMDSGILMVELAGGRYVRPDRATPETVDQLIAYLKKGYPGRSAVLSLYLPTQGLAMGGRVLADLPPSVLDSLRAGTTTSDKNLLKTKLRRVFSTQRLIAGRERIRLRVQSEVSP